MDHIGTSVLTTIGVQLRKAISESIAETIPIITERLMLDVLPWEIERKKFCKQVMKDIRNPAHHLSTDMYVYFVLTTLILFKVRCDWA